MLSLPAIAGQAIEPMAQLMETAYIGRVGKFYNHAKFISLSISSEGYTNAVSFSPLSSLYGLNASAFHYLLYSMTFSYCIFLLGSSKLIGNFEVMVSSFQFRILCCM